MAHVTDLGFTMEELDAALIDGDVRRQEHPNFPWLSIYNYSEEVQYRNKWNRITLACRGLILNNQTGEVVARPWEKFFNLGQHDNQIDSTAPVEVTDKLDGSLGILYRRPDGEFAIATRGSFASEQALHATDLLHTKYADYIADQMTEWYLNETTYLFEIIYPDNRIVVNYGDRDELVLLGGVNKKYGYYYGPTEAQAQIGWHGPVAEVFQAKDFVSALSLPDRKGKEGYVIRSGNKIVKLKQADYVELHRIVTNLSPKTIWEMIGNGQTVADICAGIPDEFHPYVENIGRELLDKASKINHDAHVAYVGARLVALATLAADSDEPFPRKVFADVAKRKPELAKYLFLLLDGKDIEPVVWQNIKPRGDVKTLVKDEG